MAIAKLKRDIDFNYTVICDGVSLFCHAESLVQYIRYNEVSKVVIRARVFQSGSGLSLTKFRS